MDRMVRDVTIALVRRGDKLQITPIDRVPNFEREITVDWVEDGRFIYGCSTTFDGYGYPFWAIKDIKIVGHDSRMD